MEDTPWLFDLKEDPDELINFYQEAQHQIEAKILTETFNQLFRMYMESVLMKMSQK